MSMSANFEGRYSNRDEIEDQLVLDNVVKLTKALQNKHHPLYKKCLKELLDASAIFNADCEFIIVENTITAIISTARAEKARTEQALKDAIAAEEIADMRKREAQANKRELSTSSEGLSLQEIIQGCEDANAWIKSVKQNIRRITTDIATLNHQIEQANIDWLDYQRDHSKRAVAQLMSMHGKQMTVELKHTDDVGNAVKHDVVIDLKQKKNQIEKAHEMPAPSKILVLNTVLHDNLVSHPEKALPYFNVLRDIRVLGAMSADDDEVCDHRVMLALLKQKKVSLPVNEEEQKAILAANELIKQRKAKEGVLERLKGNLVNATNKFNEYEQLMLSHKDHDQDNSPTEPRGK